MLATDPRLQQLLLSYDYVVKFICEMFYVRLSFVFEFSFVFSIIAFVFYYIHIYFIPANFRFLLYKGPSVPSSRARLLAKAGLSICHNCDT